MGSFPPPGGGTTAGGTTFTVSLLAKLDAAK